MIKKFVRILAVAFALTLTVTSALADSGAYVTVDSTGKVTVSVTSDKTDVDNYTFYVMDEETSLEASQGINELTDLIKLEQIKPVITAGKSYNFTSLSTNLVNVEGGSKLKVVLGGGEFDGYVLHTIYPLNTEDINTADAIAELKAADISNISTVLSKYEGKIWVLNYDNEVYKNYSADVLKKLVEIVKEDTSDDVAKMFNTACFLTELENCDVEDVFSLILKNERYLNLNCTNEIELKKQRIAEAFVNLREDSELNPLNTVTDLKTMLYRSEALGLLNDATRDTVIGVLKDYNGYFDVDFDGDFKRVDPYAFEKNFVSDGDDFKSKKDVQDIFDDVVEKLPKKAGGSSGGGGGGGAGGTVIGGLPSSGELESSTVESYAPVDKNFADIGEARWAEPYITYLKDRDILTGDGNGNVRPNDSIKREEFIKLLLTALNPEIPEEDITIEFTDATPDAWYMTYIKDAVKSGIVNGISEDLFGVGSNITRQDAAVMMYRAVNAKKAVLNEVTAKQNFTDSENIADYAVIAVNQLQMSSVLSGYEDGTFLPKNNISRAEAAKIIYTVLKNINEL